MKRRVALRGGWLRGKDWNIQGGWHFRGPGAAMVRNEKARFVKTIGRTKFEAQTTIVGGSGDDRALVFELVFTYTPWGKL